MLIITELTDEDIFIKYCIKKPANPCVPSWFHYFSHTYFSLDSHINRRCYACRCNLVPSRTWTLPLWFQDQPRTFGTNRTPLITLAVLLILFIKFNECFLTTYCTLCEVYSMFVIRSPNWTKSWDWSCTSSCAFCNYRVSASHGICRGWKICWTLSSGSFLLQVVTYHGPGSLWWAFFNTLFFFWPVPWPGIRTCTLQRPPKC